MKHFLIFIFLILLFACSNSRTNNKKENGSLLVQISELENTGQIDHYLAFRLKIFDKYINETKKQEQIKGKTIYQIIDDLDKIVNKIGEIKLYNEHQAGKFQLQVRKELTQDSIEYIFSYKDLTGQKIESLTIDYHLFDIFGSHQSTISISCENPECLESLDELKIVEPKVNMKTKLITLDMDDFKKYGIEPNEEYLYTRFLVNKLIVKYSNGAVVNYNI